MASPVTGLHHVSSITGAAQAALDYYGGRLGLRLVKQTVNFDSPTGYHLYFADGEARPGSFLTFFPMPDAAPGRAGAGQPTATAYAVPPGAIDRWMDALADAGDDVGALAERFGERVLTLTAPDGLVYDLVETADADGAWAEGAVPADRALGAFHSVTLCSAAPDATARVLADVFGYEEHGQEERRLRLVHPAADRARFVDLDMPDDVAQGRSGVGTVHHVAFRVPSDEAQAEVRERLLAAGLMPTGVRDRQYFRSVYVREPGGILFEVATAPPGFAVDEAPDALGTAFQLPPQYEPRRAQIEARLPALRLPY